MLDMGWLVGKQLEVSAAGDTPSNRSRSTFLDRSSIYALKSLSLLDSGRLTFDSPSKFLLRIQIVL